MAKGRTRDIAAAQSRTGNNVASRAPCSKAGQLCSSATSSPLPSTIRRQTGFQTSQEIPKNGQHCRYLRGSALQELQYSLPWVTNVNKGEANSALGRGCISCPGEQRCTDPKGAALQWFLGKRFTLLSCDSGKASLARKAIVFLTTVISLNSLLQISDGKLAQKRAPTHSTATCGGEESRAGYPCPVGRACFPWTALGVNGVYYQLQLSLKTKTSHG